MNKFIERLKAAIAALGLEAKASGKNLTKTDQASIVKEYNKANGDDAFNTDFAAHQKEMEAAAAQENAFAQLADILGTAKDESNGSVDVSAVVAAVKDLQTSFEKLAKQASEDKPSDNVVTNVMPMGMHTQDFAFGIENPVFAAAKRWNTIAITRSLPQQEATQADKQALENDFVSFASALTARYQKHVAAGTIATLRTIKSDASLAELSQDTEIGTRRFTVRQDALIMRIVQLPGLDGIFSKVSGVQSGNIFTNFLATEVSQAYQPGEVFKGDVSVVPEKAYVDKVMAKIRFEDMSELETSYLNYLNRSGSDPVKWSLIEWLVLELAKQINSEQNKRAILGHRVEPVKNQAGPVLFGSTGVLHRLFTLFDEHKVLPFMDADLAHYNNANMLDFLQNFCAQLQEATEDWEHMTLYLNKAHRPWFVALYEAQYGKDNDYTGVNTSKVPNYELPIKWVPNMGNICFVFATIDGNICLLENVPGEENDMKFERHLEEVIAYSYWKEGAGVAYAGKPHADLAALKKDEFQDQMIFMNWPAVDLAKDATTIDAKKGIVFRTASNTSAKGITDIIGAREGIVYRIEIGGTENPTKIEKSGKFSEIASAWNPSKAGEYIKVYYSKVDAKFHEISRG